MSAATPAGGNFGVGTWIERRARITPAHLALVGDGRSLTYADLAGRIRRLANALLNLGVGSAIQTSLRPLPDPNSGRGLICRVSASCSPVGAPVPERLIRAYLDRGVTLLQGYGLSEAAPLVLLLDPESALTKVGSAGKPPLLIDVRIVDPNDTDVRHGDTGELLVRGPNVMAGYWDRPSATREVLDADGWLRTGDAARADKEGYVWIVDRIADRGTQPAQHRTRTVSVALLSGHHDAAK